MEWTNALLLNRQTDKQTNTEIDRQKDWQL